MRVSTLEEMGKKKNGRRERGVPFALRYEPPSASGAAGSMEGGNPLRGLFPDMEVEVLDQVLMSSEGDVEAATAKMLEMLAPVAGASSEAPEQQPATRPGPGGESVFELLPHDLLLKLLGSAFFRPLDLLVCASCCRAWRAVIRSILAGVKSVDMCHQSDAVNMALLRACTNADKVRIRGGFQAFMQLARNAPSLGAHGHAVTLETIHLQQCDGLTDELLAGLLMCTPALRSLKIDSCPFVSDGAFADLWEHRLRIDMGEVTGELMAKLENLEVQRCRLVTGQALKYAIMSLCGAGEAGAGAERGGRCLEGIRWAGNGRLQQEAVVLAARRLKTLHIKDEGSLTDVALIGCERCASHLFLKKRSQAAGAGVWCADVFLHAACTGARAMAPGPDGLQGACWP